MFRRAADYDSLPKILLYGLTGAGKTRAAGGAPGAAVLELEANGLETLRRDAPGAQVMHATTWADVRDYMRLAVNGDLPEGTRTVVVDGLTEASKLLLEDMRRAKGGPDAQLSLQDWGTYTERMRRFMRTLRDLPYAVVATALAATELEEATGVRWVQPLLEGRKLGPEIGGYFSLVGYLFKRERQAKDGQGQAIVYRAMLTGPSRYAAKPCGPVVGIMPCDLVHWFGLLDGTIEPEPEPEAEPEADSGGQD